jgi:hypothetical protein
MTRVTENDIPAPYDSSHRERHVGVRVAGVVCTGIARVARSVRCATGSSRAASTRPMRGRDRGDRCLGRWKLEHGASRACGASISAAPGRRARRPTRPAGDSSPSVHVPARPRRIARPPPRASVRADRAGPGPSATDDRRCASVRRAGADPRPPAARRPGANDDGARHRCHPGGTTTGAVTGARGVPRGARPGPRAARPGLDADQRPAAAFSSSTLSVFSQVKSASSRPKWP